VVSAGASRLALAGAALAWAALAAAPARAQSPATLRVDDVRVAGGGRHRVVVSVLDAGGGPVPGLEPGFRVTVDGQPVHDLAARTVRAAHRGARVTLVVDAALLAGDDAAGVRAALDALGRSLAPGDRVRRVAAGARPRAAEAPAREAAGLAAAPDGAAAATPRLYDALAEALRGAAGRGAASAEVVVVVTRGVDGDSRRGALDALALARGPRRLTPVSVVLLAEGGESERLRRLAEQAGGVAVSATSTASLAPLIEALARRALGAWVVEFRVPGWERGRPAHALSLMVEKDGVRRAADTGYDTAAALAPPWWRSPMALLGAGLALALAVAALFVTRRRQRGLLVHDGDDLDGVWYELFAFPVTVGAAAGNDLVLDDPQVSRNHAVLEARGRAVEVVDLNSENGTHVNGERVSRRALADGDRISLGPDVHLIYEARG
jgi:hypothetical protein